MITWNVNNKNLPPLLTIKQRLQYAKIVNTLYKPQQCGCIFFEQHLVECQHIQQEELEGWDSIMNATPLQQADRKRRLLLDLKNSFMYLQEEITEEAWPDNQHLYEKKQIPRPERIHKNHQFSIPSQLYRLYGCGCNYGCSKRHKNICNKGHSYYDVDYQPCPVCEEEKFSLHPVNT